MWYSLHIDASNCIIKISNMSVIVKVPRYLTCNRFRLSLWLTWQKILEGHENLLSVMWKLFSHQSVIVSDNGHMVGQNVLHVIFNIYAHRFF